VVVFDADKKPAENRLACHPVADGQVVAAPIRANGFLGEFPVVNGGRQRVSVDPGRRNL